MRLAQSSTRPQLYLVRFEGGPWDGSTLVVPARASGDPPDFQSVAHDGDGVYALAGAADERGRLPYWWMPWDRAALLQRGTVDLDG
jgi:hypothetical protein